MEKLLEYLSIAGSLLFVFFAIGLCIFFHELGHFLAAKWRGLHIDAFALGFKPFWRKKYNGVEYRLGWLPFGGYCEIPQVDATGDKPKAADGTELERAKPLDRAITAVAGPLFNVLFGLLLGCAVWFFGMPQDSPKMRELKVMSVDEKGPEYAAGLRKNDVIVKLNGKRFFDTWAHFVSKILFTIGEVELEVLRDGKTHTVRYVPRPNPNAPEKMRAEGIAWPYFKVLIPLELVPEKGSVAEKSGIRKGDILLAVDGTEISDFHEYQSMIDLSRGRELVLDILRDGKKVQTKVTPVPIAGLDEEFTRYLVGVGIVPAKDGKGIRAASVSKTLPAERAGLMVDDVLIAVNGKEMNSPVDFIRAVHELKTKPFTLTYMRKNVKKEVTLAAEKVVPHTIGVSILLRDHPTPWQLFMSTIDMSWKSLRGIVVGLANKLGLTEKQSSIKPSHMSGPLGIGMVLFNSVHKSSLISGIYFTVVISFALAIFNLLPFPVLDGGHIVFGLIEMALGKPLPNSLIKILSNIFVALLIGLMIFVTFSDSRRLYREFFPASEGEKKNAVPPAAKP
ncbi:MAG: PDZ domain-containing protein [Lentisphaerae bacterium]|nr:PDZ domain-containing protein [Lentisphaerota bacterium]